jgi:SEC-C motif-containing protein
MKSCPCGSGRSYDDCCGQYISGKKAAPTAEALMRSRYTAYAVHAVDYIVNTCVHDGKRQIDVEQTREWSEKSQWLSLKILSTSKGGPTDDEGVVEFEATYITDGLQDRHHERANFKKVNGSWLYDDGQIVPTTIVRAGPKIGRNDLCPCGRNRKYKQCCGRNVGAQAATSLQ